MPDIDGRASTKETKSKTNIVTPSLAAALDGTQVSDRKAAIVLTETARSLGYDPLTLAINRNIISRSRKTARAKFVQTILNKFYAKEAFTVQWDGKFLEDLTTKKYVDRLSVLVFELNVNRLLGIPKLASGTDEAQAQAAIDVLE